MSRHILCGLFDPLLTWPQSTGNKTNAKSDNRLYRSFRAANNTTQKSYAIKGKLSMLEVDNADENSDILRFFADIKKFSTLPDDELLAFIKAGRLRIYEPGEILIKEGEYDCWVYILISGNLQIVKAGKPIGNLQRNGDMFGEMGIIDGSPRSASIYAINKSLVLGLDASQIDQKLKASNLSFCYVLYRLFAEALAARLRDTTQENIRLREAISKIGHIDY